jgi:hypothetical protein
MKYCSCVCKHILPIKACSSHACEKNTQVVGTLISQDKEGFGSVISHEENVKFVFEESLFKYI